MSPEVKPQHRAKIISKWIDIAQELRVLKNFSSLKAIISGLQSNPIYRLRKAWTYVPKDKLEVFEELARIFSGENNALAQRELLVREGTARFADTVGENDHQMQKILQKHSENSRAISYGTIPYLGTFLTDLTMIDTAIPDTNPDGLINFDKRRKEFEVLAQIKLLQGAANAYLIEDDHMFKEWFDSVLLLDEREAFDLSCKLEPGSGINGSSSASKDNRYKKKSASSLNGVYHRKNDSIASTASSSSGSQFYETDSLPSSSASPQKASSGGNALDHPDVPEEEVEDEVDETLGEKLLSPLRRGSGASGGGSGQWSSALSSAASNLGGASSVDSGPSNAVNSEPNPVTSSSHHKLSVAAKSEGSASTSDMKPPLIKGASSGSLTKPTADSPYKTSEFYIIRVSINANGPETEGTNTQTFIIDSI